MAAEPDPVLVTGAGGFVGRALVRALAGSHPVIATDRAGLADVAGLPGVETVTGELTDPAVLARLTVQPVGTVIHLATVPGGAAEADPALAARVNVAATMDLLDRVAGHSNCPQVLFASSIAVFGEPLPPMVDDATPVRPMLRYGAHKAMVEEWLATLTRRGEVRGLSLRLPGIVARPLAPSGMKSAFLSNLFHALKGGAAITLPVGPEATSWLLSRRALIGQLLACADLSIAPESARLTLPAQRVKMGDLVGEIARQTGADPQLAHYAPDPAIAAAFGAQPPLATPAADALGLRHDGDLAALVANALAELD